MTSTNLFNGYAVHIGNQPALDVPMFQREARFLTAGTVTPLWRAESIDQEQRGIKAQAVGRTDIFEKNRIPVRDALQALVGYVFQRFNLPRDRGLDIGSGATGEMVGQLLPASMRADWIQMELCAQAHAENQRRHPSLVTVEGSYLNMDPALKESFNIVTGLSSLDATQFLPEAIKQIGTVLVAGGYLLHVQDVRPGEGCGIREMNRLGYSAPYPVELMQGQPMTYRIGDEYVNVGEIFRREMGRVLASDPNMEVLMNDWVTVEKPNQLDYSMIYFMNSLMKLGSPTPMQHTTQASAVVTVARKR